MSKDWCQVIDWCQWIDWLIDLWFMNNVYVLSLMRMIDVKWKPIDEYGSRCIDEDGSMSCHWYMMKRWKWIDVVSLIYDA